LQQMQQNQHQQLEVPEKPRKRRRHSQSDVKEDTQMRARLRSNRNANKDGQEDDDDEEEEDQSGAPQAEELEEGEVIVAKRAKEEARKDRRKEKDAPVSVQASHFLAAAAKDDLAIKGEDDGPQGDGQDEEDEDGEDPCLLALGTASLDSGSEGKPHLVEYKFHMPFQLPTTRGK
jgi:hypothetical protein